jgi:hypothetical protein
MKRLRCKSVLAATAAKNGSNMRRAKRRGASGGNSAAK